MISLLAKIISEVMFILNEKYLLGFEDAMDELKVRNHFLNQSRTLQQISFLYVFIYFFMISCGGDVSCTILIENINIYSISMFHALSYSYCFDSFNQWGQSETNINYCPHSRHHFKALHSHGNSKIEPLSL